ncbi:hypothetical protein EBJ43_23225 [Escherichia coli]|nr:hypothetical protein [Escherichia coli]
MCIVFDYSCTLTQIRYPLGLWSLLMREYGDDTAHGYVRLKCLYQIWVTQSAIIGSGCGDDVKQAHLDYLN